MPTEDGKEIYEAFCQKHRLCSGCEGKCWDEFGLSCNPVGSFT